MPTPDPGPPRIAFLLGASPNSPTVLRPPFYASHDDRLYRQLLAHQRAHAETVAAYAREAFGAEPLVVDVPALCAARTRAEARREAAGWVAAAVEGAAAGLLVVTGFPPSTDLASPTLSAVEGAILCATPATSGAVLAGAHYAVVLTPRRDPLLDLDPEVVQVALDEVVRAAASPALVQWFVCYSDPEPIAEALPGSVVVAPGRGQRCRVFLAHQLERWLDRCRTTETVEESLGTLWDLAEDGLPFAVAPAGAGRRPLREALWPGGA